MHIGLIGGIGPAATIAYYQRLTDRARHDGRALDLTIVQADVGALIQNNLADDRQVQARVYAELINRLAAAGAECAAITSLGGHFCFDETVALSSLPLISGVLPLDAYFQNQGIGTVGLLGTAVVMRTSLYGQLTRTRAIAPTADLDQLGRTYQAMAVRGACTAEERALFLDAGAQMVRDQGAEAVVLAGTDLGLAFDGSVDPGYPVIDALDVHVDLLYRLTTDQVPLP